MLHDDLQEARIEAVLDFLKAPSQLSDKDLAGKVPDVMGFCTRVTFAACTIFTKIYLFEIRGKYQACFPAGEDL